ncbi:PAS domain S-box-containing protein [Chitinophaga skermanii]|uniref:histidine kinase n=2 Tax=Chitinophaga skermanii TaxID=331697 RepID=A0A327QKR1_9BACT|nr:PAS domain S-box-containing protein [Chitinophaga skermanii]
MLHTSMVYVDQVIAQLRQNDARYRQLLKQLPVAIFTLDAQGIIIDYNEEATVIWGKSPGVGTTYWRDIYHSFYLLDGSTLHEADHPTALALQGVVAENGKNLIIQNTVGERRQVKLYPRVFYNAQGERGGVMVMIIDFTGILKSEMELEESEQQLQQLAANLQFTVETRTNELERKNLALKLSEERYHKMIEEVEDYAILLLDKDGYIMNWNRGAEKIKGYSEEEIVGKHFRVFYLPHDLEKNVPGRLINEARITGKAIHEGWRKRKDGSTFWGSVVLTALHNDLGEIIGFTKVTRDLTERKTAEDKLNLYARELEGQNRELQQFAYAAAHDMKEPLRKIQFYISAISNSPNVSLPQKEQYFLERTIDAAVRMQGLIEDLLAYTRISSEESQFEPVDLQLIMREVVSLHQENIQKVGATVRYSGLPTVRGIRFQLRQLLDNLVGNSLKYHNETAAPHVEISSEQVLLKDENQIEQPFYKITVADNGIGFDPIHREKIFVMFERLHGREQYPGTGIGLAICKKIVQNHFGFIQATGKLGEGAEFTVFLPAVGK